MLAYVDFFLGGDEKRSDLPPRLFQRFPLAIHFGGDGSYMAPFTLHSDNILTSLMSLVCNSGQEFWRIFKNMFFLNVDSVCVFCFSFSFVGDIITSVCSTNNLVSFGCRSQCTSTVGSARMPAENISVCSEVA